MKKIAQQATKAQAQAVRTYLQSLGVEISHVQALEVLARGQGLRSRHNLARPELKSAPGPQSPSEWVDANVRGNPILMQAMKNHARAAEPRYTQVGYAYVDGSNCKRFSSMTFRGRIKPEQLRFMASKMDEGLYFVPCQVGFESLHLAFTDDGGDDHFWHKMELGEEKDWTLDEDGFVLNAGDVRQVPARLAQDFATDADCDNLFWRFARVLKWEPELQEEVLRGFSFQAKPSQATQFEEEQVLRLAQQWSAESELKKVPLALLVDVARRLLEEGFLPFPGIAREVRRPVGPNAYQFCILQACEPEFGVLALNFDVATQQGTYLTETPVLAVDVENAGVRMSVFCTQIAEQLRQCRVLPAAYDAALE